MRTLILGILFPLISFSQGLTSHGTFTLDADVFVGMDSYQNTYYIKDNVLHKKGPLGGYVFIDYQLGSITTVDIINPLKVLVFYKTMNTAIFLDNRLNEIERIRFDEFPEFINVGAAANAGNNLLWVFDIDSQQLQLYDYRNHRKTVVSQPISGEIMALEGGFTYCHILTSDSLFTFNIYGSFISEQNARGCKDIAQYGGDIVVLKDKMLFYLPLDPDNTDENNWIPLSEKDTSVAVKDFQLAQNFLYLFDGNLIHMITLSQIDR